MAAKASIGQLVQLLQNLLLPFHFLLYNFVFAVHGSFACFYRLITVCELMS